MKIPRGFIRNSEVSRIQSSIVARSGCSECGTVLYCTCTVPGLCIFFFFFCLVPGLAEVKIKDKSHRWWPLLHQK